MEDLGKTTIREGERLLGRLEGALSGAATFGPWRSLMLLHEAAALASLEDQFCSLESAIRVTDEKLREGAPKHTWPALDYCSAAPALMALPGDPPLPLLDRLADSLTRQSRGEGAPPPQLDGIAWAGFGADLYRLGRQAGGLPDLMLLGEGYRALIARAPFGASPFAQRLALALLPWIGRRLGIAEIPLCLLPGLAKHRAALDPSRAHIWPGAWSRACVEGLTQSAAILTRVCKLRDALIRKNIIRRERRGSIDALCNFFAARPIFTGPSFAHRLGMSAPSALEILHRLSAAGLLHAMPGRNKVKQYQVLLLLGE